VELYRHSPILVTLNSPPGILQLSRNLLVRSPEYQEHAMVESFRCAKALPRITAACTLTLLPSYAGYTLITLFDTKLPTVREKINLLRLKLYISLKRMLHILFITKCIGALVLFIETIKFITNKNMIVCVMAQQMFALTVSSFAAHG